MASLLLSRVLGKSGSLARLTRSVTILADGNGKNRNKLLCTELVLDFENDSSPVSYANLVKSTLQQYKFPIITFSYTKADVVEHAKSVGALPGDPAKDHFVNPRSSNFQVLPTFLLPLTNKILLDMAKISDFMHAPKTVHGEHYIRFPSPRAFPTEGVLNMEIKTLDVLDKEKGTLYCYNMNAYAESGEMVFHSEYQMFEFGTGGFGGNKKNAGLTRIEDNLETNQTSAKNFKIETKSLNKDYEDNLSEEDLRISYYSSRHPRQYYSKYEFFPQAPICHGRYYFGAVLLNLIGSHMEGDANRVKSAKVRFSNPVFAGDKISVDAWTDTTEKRIAFEGSVTRGRDGKQQNVMKGGFVEMK